MDTSKQLLVAEDQLMKTDNSSSEVIYSPFFISRGTSIHHTTMSPPTQTHTHRGEERGRKREREGGREREEGSKRESSLWEMKIGTRLLHVL